MNDRLEHERESAGESPSHRASFGKLHERLLERLLEDTETLHLHPALKAAANEAASLAWTTGYPLLVYPGLLAEKAQNARLRENRREQIWHRSQALMEQAV